MASKFVRSLKDVKDIQKLSKNVIEENDIVSTEDGKTYIVTKTDFIEIAGSDDSLAKQVDTNKKAITTLKSQATDFEKRIKALETPAT